MIPKAPVNNVVAVTGDSERRRNILFEKDNWEIVLYRNWEMAYAVHSCRAALLPEGTRTKEPMVDTIATPLAPRAITQNTAIVKNRTEASPILCWNCSAQVPDEIITIVELFNG
jgi:hypothetical protein